MKTSSFSTFIYSIIIVLHGIMAYSAYDNINYLVFEALIGLILFINCFFQIKDKKFSYIIVLVLSSLLSVYYGYNFYIKLDFFQGLMTAVSVFIFLLELFKVTKLYNE